MASPGRLGGCHAFLRRERLKHKRHGVSGNAARFSTASSGFFRLTFLLNLNHTRALSGFYLPHAQSHFASKFENRFGMWRIFALKHDGFATISGLSHFWIEFDAAEKWNTKLLRHILSAAARENIDFVVAVRAGEEAHVLDDPDEINLHLAEHLDRFARVLQRDVGRSRDHDRASERHRLHQR